MIKRGDILFRQGAYHHTMVVSNPLNYADALALNKSGAEQEIEIIHAASVDSGVYRELLDIPAQEAGGNAFRFYRPTDHRIQDGVNFATLWAHYRSETGKVTRKAPDGRRAAGPETSYSYKQETAKGSGIDMSRYSGVQDQLKQGANPAFEFDALYRSFKWATRMRTGFSKSRGTTCCAFITACFQAAAVDHYTKSFEKTAKGLELLKELRGDKMNDELLKENYVEVGPNKKKIAFKALRDHNNPGGFKDKYFGVNDYCRFVTKELHGKELTIDQIFPSALLVDAKYNYSKNFEALIAANCSGFMRIL